MTETPHDAAADPQQIIAELQRKLNERTAERDEATSQQAATADILKVISRSTFDLQAVLDALTESAAKLCKADMATITRKGEGGEFYHVTNYNFPADWVEYARKHPFKSGRGSVLGLSLIEKRAIQVADVLADPEYTRGEQQKRAGFRTVLAVPLQPEGKPIGVFILCRRTVSPFLDKQIELMSGFADQAVIAIENARLFDEVQARTRDLTESLQQQTATADVLKVISRSAFDLQAVLDTLTSSAVELSGATNGVIALREGGAYRYRAFSASMTPDFARYLAEHPPIPGPSSGAGRAILSGRIEMIQDVLEDPSYTLPMPSLNQTRSILAVPLLRDDRIEGAFVVTGAEPGPFPQRQVDLVQTFADQAVIAIENTRLFEEVQARTKELAASLDDLRKAQDRLVQSEKLASLGQLTAGIAHEIKNPLNFVNNFSALSVELTGELNDVLKPVVMDGKVREDVDELTGMLKSNLEKVVQHGKRADSIVKNMLLHSREGSGEQRPADINALLDESLNLAYHGARAEKADFNIALQRDLDPSVGMADLYPQEITRVLLNIIANGFYAATKRKAEAGEGFEPTLAAVTKNLGDKIEIRIRDNGTGIPNAVKEKIFNPFFTTKPPGEGTGLGLSMSHDIIVKQHGGSIDVETEPGLFTEFKIVLPRTSQK